VSVASEILALLRSNRIATTGIGALGGGALGAITNTEDPLGGAIGGSVVGAGLGFLGAREHIPTQLPALGALAEDVPRMTGEAVREPLVPMSRWDRFKSGAYDTLNPLYFGADDVRMRVGNLIHGGANEADLVAHPLVEEGRNLLKQGLGGESRQWLGYAGVDPAWDIVHSKQQEALGDMTLARHNGDTNAYAEARARFDDYTQKLAHDEVATRGMTPEGVAAAREAQKARLTPEQYAAVEGFGRKFQDSIWNVTTARHSRGEIPDELYQEFADRRARDLPYFPANKDSRALTPEGQLMERMGQRAAYLGRRREKIGLASLDDLIKPLEGSTLPLADPWESGFRYLTGSVRESKMNDAARTIVEGAQRNAPDRLDGTPFTRELLGSDAHLLPGEEAVSFMEQGKLRRFAIPAEYADLMNVAEAQQIHDGMRIMGKAMRMNSAMLTATNVAFVMRNIPRDVQAAMILVRQNPGDLRNWAKYYGETLAAATSGQMTERMAAAMKEGAVGGNLTRQLQWAPEYQKMLGKGGNGFLGGIVDTMQRLTNATEIAPKVAQYHVSLEGGMSPIESAYRARNYAGSPDFARQGTTAAAIRPWVQFWNPQIQGMARNIERAREDPAYMAMWMGVIASGYLATDAYNRSFVNPDTGKPYIDDVDPRIRANNLIFMDPTGPTHWSNGMARPAMITIPLDHVSRLLMSPVMTAVQMAHGEAGAPTVAQGVSNVVSQMLPINGNIQTSNPLESTGMAVLGTTNPLIQTAAEELMDKDTYSGQAIEGSRLSALQPTARYTEDTSPTARSISMLLDKIGMGKTNFASPARIEHVLESLAPGIGQQVVRGLDFRTRTAISPTEIAAKGPGIGALMGALVSSGGGSEERRRLQEQLYGAAGAGQEATRTLNETALRGGDVGEFVNQNLPAIAAGKGAAPIVQAMSEIRKYREALLRDPSLSPSDRQEQLENLYKIQMEILRGTVPTLQLSSQ